MSYNLENSSAKENRSPFALLQTTSTSLTTNYLETSTADWVTVVGNTGAITSTGVCFHSAGLSFLSSSHGGMTAFSLYAGNEYPHLSSSKLKAGTHSSSLYADVLGAYTYGNGSFYGVGTSLTLTKITMSTGAYEFDDKKAERSRSLVRRLA